MCRRPVLLCALAVALSSSCAAPTELKEVQASPQPGAKRPTKALVIALSGKPEVRSAFEADMASRLQAIGIAAVQGQGVLPPGTQVTADELRAVVKREGADAVVIARLAASGERQVAEPAPTAFYAPYGFYGYYAGAAPLVYQPSYLATERFVTLETRLYRTEGEGQLVWRGVSETLDPATPADVIRGTNEQTVARMQKDGVL
jgi:hypothetical protein